MDEGTNLTNDAPGAWEEDESKVFVEYGRAMVPSREEIERTILDLIPSEPDDPFSGVEISTGAGWLSAAVLREFPKAKMVGLDFLRRRSWRCPYLTGAGCRTGETFPDQRT